MTAHNYIYRSVLYMPGSNARALEKAKTLAADALILDLEDAVTPNEKTTARELVCAAVKSGGYGDRALIVRINPLASEWGREDLRQACHVGPDAILVPKVNAAQDLHKIEMLMIEFGAPEHTQIWAMMETPPGILNAREICASTTRLQGLVMGTNDLVKELEAAHTSDRAPVLTSLSLCLLAARAHGLLCVDGVYNTFRDDDGLRVECQQGRDLGFDGKTLIHPAQIFTANEVFAPSDEDIAQARAYIEAFEAVQNKGEGVAVVNGRIVENLHVETANKLLAKANLIAKRQ